MSPWWNAAVRHQPEDGRVDRPISPGLGEYLARPRARGRPTILKSIRRVRRHRECRWLSARGRLLFLATPLEGYDVGLDEVEDGVWSIYFCQVLIARFTERDHIIRS